MQTRKRSVLKSVTWRALGIGLLALITWAYTQSYITTSIIVLLHHGAFVAIFYFHDRVWGSRELGKKVWIKAFTYEIVLGFLVLGVITFVITGSWRQVTNITVLYLGIRFLGFPIHERLYDRFHRRGKTY